MMTTMIRTMIKTTATQIMTDHLKYRHEDKYKITFLEGIVLSNRLKALFRNDHHADENGIYTVNSLYFDTIDDQALQEKINGINEREKFRIRYYNHDLSAVFLEKKMKKNNLCCKQKKMISAEQAKMLMAGDYRFLSNSKDPLLAEFYRKLQGGRLQAKTVVSYDREAFVCPYGNVRITVDRRLRTKQPYAFLDTNTCFTSIPDDHVILEVKYDEYLPWLAAKAVCVQNRRAQACSKYVLCRCYG